MNIASQVVFTSTQIYKLTVLSMFSVIDQITDFIPLWTHTFNDLLCVYDPVIAI